MPLESQISALVVTPPVVRVIAARALLEAAFSPRRRIERACGNPCPAQPCDPAARPPFADVLKSENARLAGDRFPCPAQPGHSAARLSFADFLERENMRIAQDRFRLGCEAPGGSAEAPARREDGRGAIQARRLADVSPDRALTGAGRLERAYRPQAPAPAAEFIDIFI